MEQTKQSTMLRALELAKQGLGLVEPNPAVGCVIVKEGRILGQGFHQQFGGPHAEINALADCRKNGFDPAGTDVYVSLEPCCHFGKTPPCVNALIDAKVARIFIAAQDPTAKVNGQGIAKLRAAGIEVQTGLCQNESEALNAAFFKHARTGRPWVILKWAQSIDGKLAWLNPPADGNWISCEQSRIDVQSLRRCCQAIVVGVNTIIADNPKLTVRLPQESCQPKPLRVVLDSHLRLPWDCNLITTPDAPTLIITTPHTAQLESEKVHKLRDAGVQVDTVEEMNHRCSLHGLLDNLGSRGVQQLLVEGGPTIQTAFLSQRLADQLTVYIAPKILGLGGKADIAESIKNTVQPLSLDDIAIKSIGTDIRITAKIGADSRIYPSEPV